MPVIPVRDIRVHYQIHGSGPRLLVISGTGGDLRARPGIFDSPLAHQFEILAYDQRGMGQTDRPDDACTMVDYAMDADALLDVLGWEQCLVFGYSFGGMVAQEFALRYPHKVRRLVLGCTSSGGAGGSSYPMQEISHLPPRDYAERLLTLHDTRRDAAWRAANPRLFERLLHDMLARRMIGADEPGREAGVRRQLEARAGHDTHARLPELRMPVFICGGRYDGLVPIENLRAMHKQIAHARLEVFEGGHLFFLQDPGAFERIAAFLRGELDAAA